MGTLPGNRIRILVVEDHIMVRQGLVALLDREPDFQVIAEASDGQQAVRLARELLPDVVLMDANLPGMSGLQATRSIGQSCPRINVLALTMHEDSDFVFGMLKAGARGYILKQAAVTELANAIRSVSHGQSALDPKIARLVVECINHPDFPTHPDDELSTREKEILQLIATGRTSKEIGDMLGLAAKTVDNYRTNILGKLGARNKVEAITIALQRGLIQVSSMVPAGSMS
ncbi:MAG: response regulator transcription factor [Chloroflexi bacterium]|nr:response regulator transcription factor [Chloroflexota bacterium]